MHSVSDIVCDVSDGGKAVLLLSAAAHIKVVTGSCDPNTNMCFFNIYM